MAIVLIFAAHGEAIGAEFVFGLVFPLIVAAVSVVVRAFTHFDVVIRNGWPYCPHCNRQVTYRRKFCRSCGYKYETFEGPPQPVWNTLAQDIDNVRLQFEDRRARREEERQQREEAAAVRAERDKEYRANGIEPGRWAWYKALPELTQAILVVLAIAASAAIVVATLFLVFSWFSGR
jgi:hypothetical protein